MRACLLALTIALVPAVVSAQPRTSWGDPDLQGIWSNATLTPLERPNEMKDKAFLSDADVADIEKGGLGPLLKILAREVALSGELSDTWLEPGTTVVRSKRSSMVVDPADGKVPYTPDGKKRNDAATAAMVFSRPSASWEDRNLVERCIIYDGVVMPNPFYLNNHHFFQTKDYVAILSEVLHVYRIIPLDGRAHVGPQITQWFGDSRGRWEGKTLVVETKNFNGKRGVRGASGQLHLVEKFTRVDDGVIDYQATLTDPANYTKPWTFENTFRKTKGPLYEYACHEGNYGMKNILSGARADERARELKEKEKAALEVKEPK